MYFRKTLAAILIAMLFIGSTVRIQGYTQLYNYKEAIAVSAGNGTTKSTSKKIVLNHDEITLAPGQTIQIKAKIESEGKVISDKAKLVWKSDKASSVSVNGQGDIKAVKPGSKAVITVSSADKKLKATCKVTVMSEQEAEGCVAIINNIKVTKSEYMLFSKARMNQFLADNTGNTTADKYNWTAKINGKIAREIVKKQALDDIQEIKIQLAKAKEAGIKLDADELKSIDAVINQHIAESDGEEAAEKKIKAAYGVSLSEYKKIYADLVLSQKYINSEVRKITVPDSEVKEYYAGHKEDFDKVTVTHILLSTVDSNGLTLSADKKAEAKKKADELLEKVNAGEDINTLAEKYSEDPGVKYNRGEYTFSKGEMVTEFEEWAFSHLPGDTGIVETAYGYHVMMLGKRIETPYDDVKETIKAGLINIKFNEYFTKRMDTWKNDSQFEIQINKNTIEKVDKSLYGE